MLKRSVVRHFFVTLFEVPGSVHLSKPFIFDEIAVPQSLMVGLSARGLDSEHFFCCKRKRLIRVGVNLYSKNSSRLSAGHNGDVIHVP